jgi:hypothetical protein
MKIDKASLRTKETSSPFVIKIRLFLFLFPIFVIVYFGTFSVQYLLPCNRTDALCRNFWFFLRKYILVHLIIKECDECSLTFSISWFFRFCFFLNILTIPIKELIIFLVFYLNIFYCTSSFFTISSFTLSHFLFYFMVNIPGNVSICRNLQ